MTELYFNARELAEMELPGFPATKMNIIQRAKKENWPSVPRPGRGGGRMYPISIFPQHIQEIIISGHRGKQDRMNKIMNVLTGLSIRESLDLIDQAKESILATKVGKHG